MRNTAKRNTAKNNTANDLASVLASVNVHSLCYDSRKVQHGSVFVAIRGLTVDGHTFIPAALQAGATVIVAEGLEGEKEQAIENKSTTNTLAAQHSRGQQAVFILVSDSRKALAVLAHTWYGEPSKHLRVFGVTGTNGKTTTTFVLKALIEACGGANGVMTNGKSNGTNNGTSNNMSHPTPETVGIIGTTGNYIGGEMLPADFTTPEAPELCALLYEMKQRGATSVVMEVSSHALALERVYGTTFAGAVFTNLTQDHLDFHGTMEHYAAAKRKLFDMLPSEAIAVVNGDDERAAFMVRGTHARTILTVGRAEQNIIKISHEELSITSTAFALVINGVAYPFQMNLVGRFNVDNAVGCLALCYALSHLIANKQSIPEQSVPQPSAPHLSASEQIRLPADRIIACLQDGLKTASPAPGRMQRVPLPNGAAAIVDYAHTPDALEKALLTCRELLTSELLTNQQQDNAPPARLVCVFGCGGNRDRTKRPKMAAIAARLADVVIVTNDNPRMEDPNAIVEDILAGIPPERRTATSVQTDRAAAIGQALTSLQHGDIALIAGKGHENYQIVGAERLHFDDLEQVTSYIQAAHQRLSNQREKV
jgi:UDP-N-acetylmuramyl tripeptide synthase